MYMVVTLTLELVLIAAAFIVGGLVCWVVREREVRLLMAELGEQKADAAKFAAQISAGESALASSRVDLAAATERLAAFERERAGVGEAMAGQFSDLAQGALEKASRNFLELANAKLGEERASMTGVLAPVQAEFAKFSAAIGALQQSSSHDLGGLKESIGQVVQLQNALQDAVRTTNDATGRLQTALQNPRVAGNWGELSLDRIVAIAGMTEYCDFDRQTGTRSSDGTMEKPDLTIHLTGGLNIPVDAKASTANYIRAVGEANEEERKRLLKQSSVDIKSRVTELRARAYDRIEGYAGMTILYVPNESMLSAALAQEPALIEDALRYNIVICSPLLLLCYLRAFANGWRIQKQQDNAEEVARRGKMLHERLQNFFVSLGKVGKYLNHTVEKFNDAVGKTNNLLVPGRELGKLLGLTGELDPVDSVDTVARALPHGSDGDDALSGLSAAGVE